MSRSASGLYNNNCQGADGMGKCVRAYAGSIPAWVFLNRHLSYAGSVRLTVGTVMWAKHLYRNRTDIKQVLNVQWQQWMPYGAYLVIACGILWNDHNAKWKVKEIHYPMKTVGPWQKNRWWFYSVTVRWNVRVWRLGVWIHSSSSPGTPGSVPDSTFSVPGWDFQIVPEAWPNLAD